MVAIPMGTEVTWLWRRSSLKLGCTHSTAAAPIAACVQQCFPHPIPPKLCFPACLPPSHGDFQEISFHCRHPHPLKQCFGLGQLKATEKSSSQPAEQQSQCRGVVLWACGMRARRAMLRDAAYPAPPPCISCRKAQSMQPTFSGHPESEKQLWGMLRYSKGLGAGKTASSWRWEMLRLWGGGIPRAREKQPWEASQRP